jgi:GWxTD domain-containing protein
MMRKITILAIIVVFTLPFILRGEYQKEKGTTDKAAKKEAPAELEDTFYEMTRLIMLKDEAQIYKHLTDKEAKESFIEDFWAKRDPSPGTPENENRMEFERRIDFIDRFYKERVGKGRGWESDRGKVYLLLGEPDEKYSQQLAVASRFGLPKQVPAEIWIYDYYRVSLAFFDMDSLGIYRLREWPVELLNAIDRAKFIIHSTDKAGLPSLKFKTTVKNDGVTIRIPIQSVSFRETAEGMNAHFKVTLFLYQNYKKIDQKEETREISGQKEELLKKKDIEITIPLALPAKGKYLIDIVVEEVVSGAKYRDVIKYKYK